jgi:hypothetical protein
MPRLAKRFDEIDSAKSGQISQEQAKAWMAQQRQQHRNAKTPPAAS